MKILSIDIGIKNLAIAIIDHNNSSDKFTIDNWSVINLCNQIPNCSSCTKPAKFTKNENHYCKKHTKNIDYKIPNINIQKLSKQSMKNLMNIATEFSIEFIKSINKTELILLIEEYMNNSCFEIIETVSANNINLIDVGVNLKLELNKVFETIDLSSIDLILIENQISPIANRMKTIQGMVAQYFINCNNYNIEFFSAANKLKLFKEVKKTTYSQRKKMSVQYTRELLLEKNMENNLEYFNNHKKKDDLADCFLQAIYYLSTFNKLVIN